MILNAKNLQSAVSTNTVLFTGGAPALNHIMTRRKLSAAHTSISTAIFLIPHPHGLLRPGPCAYQHFGGAGQR